MNWTSRLFLLFTGQYFFYLFLSSLTLRLSVLCPVGCTQIWSKQDQVCSRQRLHVLTLLKIENKHFFVGFRRCDLSQIFYFKIEFTPSFFIFYLFSSSSTPTNLPHALPLFVSGYFVQVIHKKKIVNAVFNIPRGIFKKNLFFLCFFLSFSYTQGH